MKRPALVHCALLAGCAGHTPPGLAAGATAPSPELEAAVQSPEAAARESALHTILRQEAADRALADQMGWPLWERYAQHYIEDDGRVVDRYADGRTTSEGQSYGLFFALVADDRPRFERLLAWTEKNLAHGDLRTRLPAWHYGRNTDGRLAILDENSASDADMWIAYALLEAARIWEVPGYHELGSAIAARIGREEVASVPGMGPVILPGKVGFSEPDQSVRLNPSYLVLPILQRFAREPALSGWGPLLRSASLVLKSSAPRGFAPDWVVFGRGAEVRDDPAHPGVGSYDAIRVYLWASLVAGAAGKDTAFHDFAVGSAQFSQLVDRIGRVPETIHAHTAEVGERDGPPGFTAVALASAHASCNRELARALRQRLDAQEVAGFYGSPPAYYDQNLALFALGFVEGRYGFDTHGQLLLRRDDAALPSPRCD